MFMLHAKHRNPNHYNHSLNVNAGRFFPRFKFKFERKLSHKCRSRKAACDCLLETKKSTQKCGRVHFLEAPKNTIQNTQCMLFGQSNWSCLPWSFRKICNWCNRKCSPKLHTKRRKKIARAMVCRKWNTSKYD